MKLTHLTVCLALAIAGLVAVVSPQVADAADVTPLKLRVVDCNEYPLANVAVGAENLDTQMVFRARLTDANGRVTLAFPVGSVQIGHTVLVTLSHGGVQASYEVDYVLGKVSGGDWDFGEEFGGPVNDVVTGYWILPLCSETSKGEGNEDHHESSWGCLKSRHSQD